MVFDPDYSQAGPGFRLGFPTIEPIYYDTDGGKNVWAYMMVTASGSRVQFRQTAVGNTYETADGSYTQLITAGAASPNDPVEGVTIKVRTTDGTQMSYVWSMGAYRCTEIKDRNGNYITLVNDSEGRLSTMTDTLGRVVTVNYDSATGMPATITQTWKNGNGAGSNVTHTWATLVYKTEVVDTDFDSSLTVVGPPDGTSVSVLDKITYADGSSTKFDYNGYLQVKKVTNIGGDSSSHILNYTSTNLATPSTTQTDCPRFTETKTFAQNFNNGNEVTINNSAPATATYSLPGSITGSAKVINIWVTGHPDNLRTKTYVGASGWSEGLPIATEDCLTTTSTCSDRKRWTWADWTQDNTSASYVTNARVKETRVGDTSNVKVTKTDYRILTGTTAEYGLVSEVRVYDGNDLNNPIKKLTTDYNLTSAYTSRRIIGLPSQVELWGKNDLTNSLEYVSKVTYGYDEENFSYESNQIVTPSRHDSTNYGSTFVAGRGNLTSTTRHDVTGATAASVSKVRYDVAGSPVAQLDPRNRKTTVSYGDNFNSTVGAATYAYPTTVTDPGGYSSTIQYRYDIGANVHAESPTPYGASDGKNTTRTYDDAIGRLVKEKIDNTGAYTRYDYPNNDGVTLKTYATVADVTGVGTIDSNDEVLTETLLDGAGRVRMTRTENPNSDGGYTGKLVEYDLLGRLKRETVPTEIDSSWAPSGDDDRGSGVWLWNSREYDWKDRVTRTVPSDSTGGDGKDTIYEYTGCGCSGGLTTTIKGPMIIAYNAAATLQTTEKRSWRKIHEDALGRVEKVEIWDLDGAGGAPYSTVKTTFNGRDQATAVVEYAGSDSSSTNQSTTMTYDGHGRLSTRRLPEYNSNTFMTWTYHADDKIASVTDPRGAISTYKYGQVDSDGGEDRALLTRIAYSSPNTSTIPDPTDVTFTYDDAGNRTYMSDETGNLTYTYDELSRLKTETKNFVDTLSSAPSGGYALLYNYHLTGGLKSMTGPFGHQVTYSVDKVGRVTQVGDGTDADAYADSVRYRSFGRLKAASLSAADPIEIALTYDNALRPATYEADSAANTGKLHEASYTYSKDGMLSTLDNQADAKFDQANKYDFAGRLKSNEVGSSGVASPFIQNLSYNTFNNLTDRTTSTYDLGPVSFSAVYANNRKTSGGSSDTYDAVGNVVSSYQSAPTDNLVRKFDAAGRDRRWEEFGPYGNTAWKGGENTYDGDGRPVKIANLTKTSIGGVWGSWVSVADRYIYSSVTEQKVTTLDPYGAHYRTHVYLESARIAEERNGSVWFNATDPISDSTRETDERGTLPSGDEEETRVELAGLRTSVPLTSPQTMPPPNYADGGYVGSVEGNCTEPDTQIPIPCDLLSRLEIYKSSATPAPKKDVYKSRDRWKKLIRGGDEIPAMLYAKSAASAAYELGGEGSSGTCTFDEQGNPTCVVEVNDTGIDISTVSGMVEASVGSRDSDLRIHDDSGLAPPAPPLPPDPCAGKKGALDFTKRMNNHIFPRHIATTTFPGRSKYTFWPWQRSRKAYEAQVMTFGQETFEYGEYVQEGNNVVYSYAVGGIDAGGSWVFREVGIDGKSKAATNVNTIIVDARDCRSVISAYPGLPRQFNTVPGAIFKSGGWSTQHASGL